MLTYLKALKFHLIEEKEEAAAEAVAVAEAVGEVVGEAAGEEACLPSFHDFKLHLPVITTFP